MPLPAHSFARLLRRFRRNRRGATAVEFAMVAPLFFGLLFAIIEVAMIFFASQVLETVTQDSSRFIMTGQAQGAATAARVRRPEKAIDAREGKLPPLRSFVLPGGTPAAGLSISSDLNMPLISKGSARILATSKKLVCTAFIAATASNPTTSGWQLTIIAKTKQKAAN